MTSVPRLAGWLIVVSTPILVVGYVLGASEGRVVLLGGNATPDAAALAANLALALIGVASIVLALASSPFTGRGSRVGLAIGGVGYLGIASYWLLVSPLEIYAESWPLLSGLLGFLLAAIGFVLLALDLARSAGLPRLIAILIIAGLVSPLFGPTVLGPVFSACIPLAFLGVGSLAIRGRAVPQVPRAAIT